MPPPPTAPPDEMLAELTRKVALSRNLDFLALDDGAIPILTVHQSKGLEFGTIIIAGMTDDEFPSYDQICLPDSQLSTNHLDS